jgi:hypothetical protein
MKPLPVFLAIASVMIGAIMLMGIGMREVMMLIAEAWGPVLAWGVQAAIVLIAVSRSQEGSPTYGSRPAFAV